MANKVIGIDLGTTNSCVAVMEGGEPVVVVNRSFAAQWFDGAAVGRSVDVPGPDGLEDVTKVARGQLDAIPMMMRRWTSGPNPFERVRRYILIMSSWVLSRAPYLTPS